MAAATVDRVGRRSACRSAVCAVAKTTSTLIVAVVALSFAMATVRTYQYFAYGSNMCSARLRQRAPSARALAAGRLPNYALRWHKLGRDGSGKCNAAYAGEDSSSVLWGVLFDIACAEKHLLDKAEGLGIGYLEREVAVVTEAGTRPALTYVAKPTHIDASLRPHAWYKDYVVRGAREHGLPEAVVAALARVEALADPASSGAGRTI